MSDQELKQALRANRPVPPRGFEDRSDAQLTRLMHQEEIQVKRFSGFSIALAIILVLTMATAVAAGVIRWQRGLDDKLKVTEEIREIYRDTQLFDQPGLSVTQNGVTVTMEQCIVDPNNAYIAFRVKGYQPEWQGGLEWEMPQFRDVLILLDGEEPPFFAEPLFFNGLDGWGLLTDGSMPEEDTVLPYVNENGEMVYIITLRCDRDDHSIIGKKLQVTLGGLGTVSSRYPSGHIDVEGTWSFEWTLKGTDRCLSLNSISLPIGGTGCTVTDVRLSPIYISMSLQVPRETYPAGDDEGIPGPLFSGVKLKDGTVYDQLAGRGYADYTDDKSDAFRQNWALHRVIDPDQVESLLFTASTGSAELIEVKIQ